MSAHSIETAIARLAMAMEARDAPGPEADLRGATVIRLPPPPPPPPSMRETLEALAHDVSFAAMHARLAVADAVEDEERSAVLASVEPLLAGVRAALADHLGPLALSQAVSAGEEDLRVLLRELLTGVQELLGAVSALSAPEDAAPEPDEGAPPAAPARRGTEAGGMVDIARLLRPAQPGTPPPCLDAVALAEPDGAQPSPSLIAARIAAMAEERETQARNTAALARLLRSLAGG